MPNVSEAFLPLSARRSDVSETVQPFQLKVLPLAQQSQRFQPQPSSTPLPASAPPTAPEPQISLQRDGDRVTHIEVRCTCGQCIELECVY